MLQEWTGCWEQKGTLEQVGMVHRHLQEDPTRVYWLVSWMMLMNQRGPKLKPYAPEIDWRWTTKGPEQFYKNYKIEVSTCLQLEKTPRLQKAQKCCSAYWGPVQFHDSGHDCNDWTEWRLNLWRNSCSSILMGTESILSSVWSSCGKQHWKMLGTETKRLKTNKHTCGKEQSFSKFYSTAWIMVESVFVCFFNCMFLQLTTSGYMVMNLQTSLLQGLRDYF